MLYQQYLEYRALVYHYQTILTDPRLLIVDPLTPRWALAEWNTAYEQLPLAREQLAQARARLLAGG